MTRWARFLAIGCLALMLGCPSASSAYTTKSPEVVAMVNKAVAYLKTASHKKPGGWALIGLALLKNKESLSHPKIVEAADEVAKAVQKDVAGMDIYSTGLSIIFLTSYDSGKYRAEIESLLKSLTRKQKSHGGWGYPDLETGDTSMTQYGVLSTWEAHKAGFTISQDVVDRVAKWLIKTQDPSGAWGYQGNYVADSDKLVPQRKIRHSLSAAGLGSVYICADLLGMTPKLSRNDDPRLVGLKEVEEPKEETEQKKVKTNVNLELIRAAENRGNNWFQANETIETREETLYYMYALERYQSFRELAEGKAQRDPAKNEGPKWYNDGVNYLKKTQKEKGTWHCEGQCDEVVNTAFGALFLLRSTQKSIQRGFGDGMLVGGVGLPKEGQEFLDSEGRVIRKSPLGPFAAMEAALERQNAADLRSAVERIDQELQGKGSDLLTSEFQKQFRKLLSDPSPENRLAAVKGLVLSGDLDNVPTLILALEDRDPDVAMAASDGLCRLTRRFDAFGLRDDSTAEERRVAAEKWKAWYLTVRPDTEF
ncbi:MAG: hypothetical protein JW719_03360 [Pirellulales bacterium]|nr:hypothetical protein [Pirellulales bacterium]